MKRILPIFAILLLLCGCGSKPAQATTEQTTVAQTEETIPPEVISWEIPDADCDEMILVGANIALLSDTEDGTRVTLVCPDDGTVLGTAMLEDSLVGSLGIVQTSSTGICYYSEKNACLVFLNASLDEVRRVFSPETPQGAVIIDSEWKKAYYSTGKYIIAMDLEAGISAKLVRIENAVMLGSLFDGDLLIFTDNSGSMRRLSVSTGQMDEIPDLPGTLRSDDGCCIAYASLGTAIQPRGEEMWCYPDCCDVYPLSPLGWIVTAVPESSGFTAEFRDMVTGDARGLYRSDAPFAAGFLWDKRCERIWFCTGGKTAKLVGIQQKAIEKADLETVYTPFFSVSNPDSEGLSACQQMLNTVAEAHGITVTLNSQVFSTLTGEYTFVPEYLGEDAMDAAGELCLLLTAFPDWFLPAISAGAEDNTITFGLFRCISTSAESPCPGVQIWADGRSYIALDAENLTVSFYHAIGHMVANRVHSATNVFDRWSGCNSWGFAYGDEEWNEDNFVSNLSATSMLEDWSETFRAAMTEDIFDTQGRQEKLTLICKGIRKAFDLDKEITDLPWEAYLDN